MSDTAKPAAIWVDRLIRKHECYDHSEPVALPFTHDGRALTLIAPYPWFGRGEVLQTTISASGDLLYMIAQDHHDEAYEGVAPYVIVARRRAPDEYAVVVYHELYPWTPEKLGLGVPAERSSEL